jgi:hypothetical protein
MRIVEEVEEPPRRKEKHWPHSYTTETSILPYLSNMSPNCKAGHEFKEGIADVPKSVYSNFHRLSATARVAKIFKGASPHIFLATMM